MAFNGLFVKVPAIFSTMCLLDNLADPAICGGPVADPPEIVPIMHVLGHFGLEITSRILYKPSYREEVNQYC